MQAVDFNDNSFRTSTIHLYKPTAPQNRALRVFLITVRCLLTIANALTCHVVPRLAKWSFSLMLLPIAECIKKLISPFWEQQREIPRALLANTPAQLPLTTATAAIPPIKNPAVNDLPVITTASPKPLDLLYRLIIHRIFEEADGDVEKTLKQIRENEWFHFSQIHQLDSKVVTRWACQLCQMNPNALLKLIQDPRYYLQTITYDYDNIRYLTIDVRKRSIHPDHQAAFLECFKFIIQHSTGSLDESLMTLLLPSIDQDQLMIFSAILRSAKKYVPQHIFENILTHDSPECLKICLEIWKEKINLARLFAQLIDLAFSSGAFKCVAILIQRHRLPEETLQKMVKSAAANGHVEIVLALHNQNVRLAAQALFLALEKKSLSAELIKKMLRYSAIDTVEGIVTAAGPDTCRMYEEARKEFLEFAPFIARYTKPLQLKDVHECYTNKLKDQHYENDIEYGIYCRKKVEHLLQMLGASAFTRQQVQQFKELASSKSGKYSLTALVEEISKTRYQKHEERSDGDKNEGFCKLRHNNNGRTPVLGRYEWSNALIRSVMLFSEAKDLQKQGSGYTLYYERIRISGIISFDCFNWFHGQAAINETWGALEDLFEDLIDFKFPNRENVLAYKRSLSNFYTKMARFVWLMGNTQPLLRGSGTVSEWLFGFFHLHHGLLIPVLKIDFPQLDCLSITFPLSDYEGFFTYFFEPSTLPKELERRPMYSGSRFQQMQQLYSELKNYPQTAAPSQPTTTTIAEAAAQRLKNFHGLL